MNEYIFGNNNELEQTGGTNAGTRYAGNQNRVARLTAVAGRSVLRYLFLLKKKKKMLDALLGKITGWNRENVIKKIEESFPNWQHKEVLKEIEKIKGDSPSGRARVQLAILKLSNKDFEKIRLYVEVAQKDFREVLMPPGTK